MTTYRQGSLGWGAGPTAAASPAPATGAELLTGLDSAGNPADLPLYALWVPQAYNWNPAVLPRTCDALGRVRAKTGSMTINIIGHSAPGGQGAGAAYGSIPNYISGAEPYSMAELLAAALNAKGFNARADSWFGVQGFYTGGWATGSLAPLLTYDARLSLVNSAVGQIVGSSPTGVSIGGGLVGIAKGATGSALAFMPTSGRNWDTCVTYDATASGTGAATLDIGGSTLATLTAGTANGFRSTTMTAGSGVNTAYLRPTSGTIYPIGQECYLSTASEIRIRSLTQHGGQTIQFLSTTYPFSPGAALAALPPADLTIFAGLMRNDQNHLIPPSTWQTNMQMLINIFAFSSDIILMHDHAPNPAYWNFSSDDDFTAGYYTLAKINNCPMLDTPARIGNGIAMSARTLFCPDNIHAKGGTWANIAGWVASMLSGLVA